MRGIREEETAGMMFTWRTICRFHAAPDVLFQPVYGLMCTAQICFNVTFYGYKMYIKMPSKRSCLSCD